MDSLENEEMIDSSNTKKYSYYKKKNCQEVTQHLPLAENHHDFYVVTCRKLNTEQKS